MTRPDPEMSSRAQKGTLYIIMDGDAKQNSGSFISDYPPKQ
jgi:hypothetical protein